MIGRSYFYKEDNPDEVKILHWDVPTEVMADVKMTTDKGAITFVRMLVKIDTVEKAYSYVREFPQDLEGYSFLNWTIN